MPLGLPLRKTEEARAGFNQGAAIPGRIAVSWPVRGERCRPLPAHAVTITGAAVDGQAGICLR